MWDGMDGTPHTKGSFQREGRGEGSGVEAADGWMDAGKRGIARTLMMLSGAKMPHCSAAMRYSS